MENKTEKRIQNPMENLVLESNCNYQLDQKIVKSLIQKIVSEEKKNDEWEININFIDHETIQKLHLEYFNDDSTTDVISFHYHEDGAEQLEGELFINVIQAGVQAKEFHVSLENEVLRLIAHGVFHLLGYDDSTDDEINAMRERENRALKNINFLLEP